MAGRLERDGSHRLAIAFVAVVVPPALALVWLGLQLLQLDAVVEFYDGGGRTNPHIDSEIHPLRFTTEEKRALVAFLRTLSGTIREGSRP